MKGKKRIAGLLATVAALTILLLPVSEADAAASASDFKMEGSTLTKYRGTDKNVSIPSAVRTIGKGAFEENDNIELVVVPNSVKRIEAYAFWGCDNLDTVVLGKGLSNIGEFAFMECTGLKQIAIPATVTSIGAEAFKGCTGLTDIMIPPETSDIDETAFDGCTRLTIHYVEGSAAEKYAKDFYERQKKMPGYEGTPKPSSSPNPSASPAPSATAPAPEETPVPSPSPAPVPALADTKVVGNSAVLFMSSSSLRVFSGGDRSGTAGQSGTVAGGGIASIPKYRLVDGQIVADQAYYRDARLGDVTLPDGISEIGQFAYSRSSLASIALPGSVERIGYGAFYRCLQLADMELPESVLCVEPKAFERTLWVDSFLAGNAGDGGFLISGGVLVAYRGSSPKVTVPKGVRVIAGEAFRGHEEIERVSLPDSLLVVGEGAFEGCSALKQVSFGKKVEEIKDRAFLGSAMEKVSLPASVKKIGLKAFGDMDIGDAAQGAERTYEVSATRLSNEAYRVYDGTESGEPGVTVRGLPGASASLAGASREYFLTVEEADPGRMEAAFQRAFRSGVPEGMALYALTLTDASGIPLTKLGSQMLDVTLPVPKALQGQPLRLVTLDRNGQLKSLKAEQTVADGTESLRFGTDEVSVVGMYAAE